MLKKKNLNFLGVERIELLDEKEKTSPWYYLLKSKSSIPRNRIKAL